MTYLAAASRVSARDSHAVCAQPASVDYTFLQQACRAPYYRAFAESLGCAALADLAEQHLRQAAERAGWPSESWRTLPVFIGSASYTVADYEQQFQEAQGGKTEAWAQRTYSLLHFADELARRSGNPHIFSFATACTSSAHALMQAHNWLESGTHNRALVLGVESLNRITLLHFHSLGLFAERYQPFGGNGLILGEGMAALALAADAPQGQGRLKLLAQAANTGRGSLVQGDAQAQAEVMRAALAAAGAAPAQIQAVKTHGVGTADSDAAEMAALQSVFGTLPPLLAFKPQTGHTLGAAAALETALLADTLQQGSGSDYQGCRHIFSDGLYLSCHFGFGGSNTATVWQWNR